MWQVLTRLAAPTAGHAREPAVMSVTARMLDSLLVESRSAAYVSTAALNDELLERACRDDYPRWLSLAESTGGCVRPIRLRGTIRDIDSATGEVVHALNTNRSPPSATCTPTPSPSRTRA